MPTKKGERIWVHKDFAESLEEDYEKVRKAVQEKGKKLSFIDFTDFYADCLKSKETAIDVQPIKTGRRAKHVSLKLV